MSATTTLATAASQATPTMAASPAIPTIPTSQRAIIQSASGSPTVTDNAPVPSIDPGTILVQTVAVALNPTDYKIGPNFPAPGAIVGIDFAGRIAHIDPEAAARRPDLHVGDLVCGGAHGSNPSDPANGAFAQLVRAPANLLLRVPEQVLPAAHAAALATGLSTAVLSLHALGIDVPAALAGGPGGRGEKVLVYGASSASGTMAAQVLKLCGYQPVGICSARNFDLARSYGCSAVFDYKVPDVVEDIRDYTGGQLRYALDCITDEASMAFCAAAMGPAGGHLVVLQHFEEAWQTREDVTVEFVLALEAFGKEVKLPGAYGRAASPEKHEVAEKCYVAFEKLLEQGLLRAHPIEVAGKDFEDIPEGIKHLASGAVSGKKLVVVFE